MELKQGALNQSPGAGDTSAIQAEIDQMQQMMQAMVINVVPTEGGTVTIPATDRDVTLNLQPATNLLELTVVLPGGQNGRVSQRVFVNSTREIDTCTFEADIQVNSPQAMFSAGDNFVYYRNQPNIFSRITS